MELPASRAEAIRIGSTKYHTGIPCKRGHVADRDTRQGLCLTCKADRRADYYAKNRLRENAAGAATYQKTRESVLARKRTYQVENRHKRCALEHRRRARRMLALPAWAAGEVDGVMQRKLTLCRDLERITGIRWAVDHMVPLRACLASGLHVGYNLQVIPAKLNTWKHNRLVLLDPFEWMEHVQFAGDQPAARAPYVVIETISRAEILRMLSA